jgi:hypothetical protein
MTNDQGKKAVADFLFRVFRVFRGLLFSIMQRTPP